MSNRVRLIANSLSVFTSDLEFDNLDEAVDYLSEEFDLEYIYTDIDENTLYFREIGNDNYILISWKYI